jgi:hypothetical protein
MKKRKNIKIIYKYVKSPDSAKKLDEIYDQIFEEVIKQINKDKNSYENTTFRQR